jgi:DNA-3-methyladenine glycosylase
MMDKALSRNFFNRPTLTVAEELLGKILVYKSVRGVITETEAYSGFTDAASHAYRGRTPRTEIMFGPSGYAYVYLIYGMYYCLNVTTEAENFPAAVLIRGLKLLTPPHLHLNGPGKLCRQLGITTAHYGTDLTSAPEFYIADSPLKPAFTVTPRIGIKVATDLPWRFVVNGAINNSL